MKKRVLASLLSAALLMGVAAGCGPNGNSSSAAPSGGTGSGGDASYVNKTGFPIVNEPISLRFMAPRSASYANGYEDMQMFKDYEKETGIDIQWDEVAEEGWSEKIKLTLASGSNLPDAIYGGSVSSSDVFKYGQQGIIVSMDDLIENYTTNAKKYLAER